MRLWLRRSMRLCLHYVPVPVYHKSWLPGIIKGYTSCWIKRTTLLHGWVRCYTQMQTSRSTHSEYRPYIVYLYAKHLLQQHTSNEILQLTLHKPEELEEYVKRIEKRHPWLKQLAR